MDNRQPATLNAAPASPTPVLVFGIIGLALSGTGILGLIFSIIALSKAKSYIRTYGPIATQANIGRRLAIAGLIVSIIMIVFWVVFITIMVIVAVDVASHPDKAKTLKDLSSYLENYTYSFN